MANPQKENGYVAIATELFEALCKIRISGEARQVLDVVFRKTYGFNKKEDKIALSQFVRETGMKKQNVWRSILKLEEMNLIVIKKDTDTNIFQINKDYSAWKPVSKKITVAKKITRVSKKDKAEVAKKIHTITNTTKDTITKDSTETSSVKEIVELLSLFSEINPKKFYGSPPQRLAAMRLIATHGMEKLKKVMAILPKTNKMPYMPTITTPYQLEDKWASLEANLIKKKVEFEAKNEKYKVAF